MVKKRGLGKGLDALLGNPADRTSENSNSDSLTVKFMDTQNSNRAVQGKRSQDDRV